MTNKIIATTKSSFNTINTFRNDEIRNILRQSPRIIAGAGALTFLVSGKLIALRFTLYVILTEFINLFLKKLSGILIKDKSFVNRPKGNNNGCGVYQDCRLKNAGDQVGMPSGHSMIAGMAYTFWMLKMWNSSSDNSNNNLGVLNLSVKITRTIILTLLFIMILISRSKLVEGCHTIPQIIIGGLSGILLGGGFYLIDGLFQKFHVTSFLR